MLKASTPVATRGPPAATTPKTGNSLAELQEKEKEEAEQTAEYVKAINVTTRDNYTLMTVYK